MKKFGFGLGASLLLFAVGCSDQVQMSQGWPLETALTTENGIEIPANVYGVVQIDTPVEASLMQLRGMSGQGVAFIRQMDSRDCLSLPLRFVAGDFEGQGISTHTAAPVAIEIRTYAASQRLVEGKEIVSDMVRVSMDSQSVDAELVIVSGLQSTQGFVLNPGQSFFADMFGVRPSREPCSGISS